MNDTLLIADNIDVAYMGSEFSLRHINLSIAQDRCAVIYGREGSGKTLLLRSLAGLEDCSGGKIFLCGKDVKEIDAKDREMGFTFDFSSLDKKKSVKEIVELPMRLRNFDEESIARDIKRTLEIFSLDVHAPVKELSEFEMVKLILARLFSVKRRLYLIDDVWKDLSSNEQVEIINLIKRVARDENIVIATQDIDTARKFSKSQICVVSNGGCVQYDSFDEMKSRPENIESAILSGYSIYMDVLGKNEYGYTVDIEGQTYSVESPLNDIYVGKKVCFAFEDGIGAKGFYYDRNCERIISRQKV